MWLSHLAQWCLLEWQMNVLTGWKMFIIGLQRKISLNNLVELQGCEIISNMYVVKILNTQIQRWQRRCRKCIPSGDVSDEIQRSTSFSIMIDDSTNVSRLKVLIVYTHLKSWRVYTLYNGEYILYTIVNIYFIQWWVYTLYNGEYILCNFSDNKSQRSSFELAWITNLNGNLFRG